MRTAPLLLSSLIALVVALPVHADKDKDKGRGHGHGPSVAMAPVSVRTVVTDRDRTAVYTFYRTEYVGGRCPPGLAKKGNGCLPPGLAKRAWSIGAPLARTITFYPLPGPLLAQLTPAPEGYQYVRVDNDVVLMALGTRIVTESVGSISDLAEPIRPLVADRDREAVAAYYRDDYLAGNCPSGLLRTNQGCQPKRVWALGEPLDPSVTYEELPQPLIAQLDPAPQGYAYGRIGEFVLLISTDSRIVNALVLDLSRLPVVGVAPAPATVIVPERVEYLSGGSCPPGLAKKNNGCLPPGHAK